jgi:ligand-binding sensor domain-containing protein
MPAIIKNRLLPCFLSLTILLSINCNISGQNYSLKVLTSSDGLPHNNVRDIDADSSGFLWLSTWDGLSRYDGFEFRNYQHIPGDTTSLPYFSVNQTCADGSNNLWVLTVSAELARFDRINEIFIRLRLTPDHKDQRIFTIDTDDAGNLWALGSDFLLTVNHQTGLISSFKIDMLDFPDFNASSIYGISFDTDSIVWLPGNNIYKLQPHYDMNGIKSYSIKNCIEVMDPSAHEVTGFDRLFHRKIVRSEKGDLYVISNTGLFIYDKNENHFELYTPVNDSLSSRLLKPSGWVDQNRSVTIALPSSSKLVRIETGDDELIDYIFVQEPGLIWYSSASGRGVSLGLTRAVLTPGFFKHYTGNANGTDQRAVFPIIKDKEGNIIAGIRGADHLAAIYPDGREGKYGTIPADLHTRGNHVRSLVPVRDGIWIGYFLDVLLFYDYATRQYTSHNAGVNSYRTITTDKSGRVYIGTVNLTVYNPETGESSVLWNGAGTPVFYKLLLINDSILWGGMGESILVKFILSGRKAVTYRILSENYHIEDICPGDNGRLWLALLGGGICEFDPETGNSRLFTTASGLPNNTTYSILKDNSGILWISTDKGISRFNPSTGVFRNFDRNDGLTINEFNSDAAYASADGEFFLGGMGGFVGFRPDEFKEIDRGIQGFRIIISDLRVSGLSRRPGFDLNESDSIILEKGENNLKLMFSTTDLANTEKVLFRHRMPGIDNGWIITDNKGRNINYSHLRPGKYKLGIEATDRTGEWAASRTLTVILKPFFYQTWLFIALVSVLLFGLFHLIISLYLRQMRNKSRQIQYHLRLQALQGQMNPHFIFNSLNSINYFISNNDKLSANRYIADFARLIRSILSNMGKDYVPLATELGSIRDYLDIEFLRFGDKFDYKVDTKDIEPVEALEVFPGLIQPFIENAIWHGVRALENRKACIRILLTELSENQVRAIIEDDGIGRWKTSEMRSGNNGHNSRGIEIVRERLQIISKLRGVNSMLEITDLHPEREECGTRVLIDIPVRRRL